VYCPDDAHAIYAPFFSWQHFQFSHAIIQAKCKLSNVAICVETLLKEFSEFLHMKLSTSQKSALAALTRSNCGSTYEHALLRALTPFQQKVLRECAKIPRGQTRTYSQIARAIGKPHAARAVGNALAINPLAPIIPCHRVVRADGSLGGYSAKGGTGKKRHLLSRERQH